MIESANKEKIYIDQHDGGHWIAGTRISLDSVVYAFRDGAAPETIQSSFPSLTLEQVYGGITYYLGHRAEIDKYLAASEIEFAELARQNHEKLAAESPDLWRRLMEAKQALQQKRKSNCKAMLTLTR